jgi:hypothetical protein
MLKRLFFILIAVGLLAGGYLAYTEFVKTDQARPVTTDRPFSVAKPDGWQQIENSDKRLTRLLPPGIKIDDKAPADELRPEVTVGTVTGIEDLRAFASADAKLPQTQSELSESDLGELAGYYRKDSSGGTVSHHYYLAAPGKELILTAHFIEKSGSLNHSRYLADFERIVRSLRLN